MITIVYNNVKTGDRRIVIPKLLLKPDFARRRWCCASGGIAKECFIINCSQKTKLSMPPNTASNPFEESRSVETLKINEQKGWSSITTTPGHTHLCALAKNYSSFLRMFYRTLRSPDSIGVSSLPLSSKLSWWKKFPKFGCHQNSFWAIFRRTKTFWEKKIFDLSNCWTKMIEQKRTYIIL